MRSTNRHQLAVSKRRKQSSLRAYDPSLRNKGPHIPYNSIPLSGTYEGTRGSGSISGNIVARQKVKPSFKSTVENCFDTVRSREG